MRSLAVAAFLLTLSTGRAIADPLKMRVSYRPEASSQAALPDSRDSPDVPCARFPAAGDGTVRLGQGVRPPRLLEGRRPDFSRLTASAPDRTRFIAEVVVAKSGEVREVVVFRSVSESFDELVFQFLGLARFEPARLDDKSVDACMPYVLVRH